MQQFSNQEIAEIKSRIAQIQELLASRDGELPAGSRRANGANDAVDPANALLVDQLAFKIQIRRMRKSHFGGALAGPVWDMMLDLMLAAVHGRELSASDLATGAEVPLSSGLRMIAALEARGLARRSIDTRDRRRTIVRLTATGDEKMRSYFEMIGKAWISRPALAM